MDTRRRPNRQIAAWGLLYSFTLLSLAGVPVTLFGVLAVPMQNELGFDDQGLGFLIAFFWVATSISGPLGGILADRWGWVPSSLLGAVISASSLVFIAFFVSSYAALVSAAVVAGVGLGVSSPSSNVVLLDTVPSRFLGQAFGIKQSATPAMAVLVGASAALASSLGWHAVYLVILCGYPVLFLLLWRVRRMIRQRVALSDEQKSAAEHHKITPVPLLWSTLITVLGTLVLTTLLSFSVLTMVNVGVPFETSGFIFALASGFALLIRIGAGYWLDRSAKLNLLPVTWLLGGSIIGILLLMTGNSYLTVTGIVIAVTCGFGWPPVMVFLVVQSNPVSPARASGINAIGSGVGSVIGPITFGFLATRFGLSAGWAFTLVVLVAAVVLSGWVQLRLIGRRQIFAR